MIITSITLGGRYRIVLSANRQAQRRDLRFHAEPSVSPLALLFDKEVFVHGSALIIFGLWIMATLQPASPADTDHVPAYDDESDYMDLKSFLVPEYESPESTRLCSAPNSGIQSVQLGMPSVVAASGKPGSFRGFS